MHGNPPTPAGMWTPAIHAETQRAALGAFWTQNGFVTFDAAARLGLPHAKLRTELPAQLPGAVLLSHAAVGASLLEQTDAAVQDALSTVGWCVGWGSG